MKRPSPLPEGSPSVLAGQDLLAWEGFPNLRSFFLSSRYDGVDAERLPGVMIVRPEGSRWVLTLKDPTAMTQLIVSGPSWDETLLLAEGLLGDDRAPWVPDQWARDRARKGKK